MPRSRCAARTEAGRKRRFSGTRSCRKAGGKTAGFPDGFLEKSARGDWPCVPCPGVFCQKSRMKTPVPIADRSRLRAGPLPVLCPRAPRRAAGLLVRLRHARGDDPRGGQRDPARPPLRARARHAARGPRPPRPFYAVEAHSMLELEPPRHTRLRSPRPARLHQPPDQGAGARDRDADPRSDRRLPRGGPSTCSTPSAGRSRSSSSRGFSACRRRWPRTSCAGRTRW
jgi:hypothetical protein